MKTFLKIFIKLKRYRKYKIYFKVKSFCKNNKKLDKILQKY